MYMNLVQCPKYNCKFLIIGSCYTSAVENKLFCGYSVNVGCYIINAQQD